MNEFSKALHGVVQELCKALASSGLPRRPWTRVVRQPDGTLELSDDTRVDTLELNIQIFRMLGSSLSLQRLLDAIGAEASLRRMFIGEGQHALISNDINGRAQLWNIGLSSFFSRYFHAVKDARFDEEIFSSLANIFLTEIGTQEAQVINITPVIGLSLASDSISVSQDASLRRITDDELEEWINQEELMSTVMRMPNSFLPLRTVDLPSFEYGIETRYEYPLRLSIGSSMPKVVDDTPKILTALRLMTNKRMRTPFTQQKTSGVMGFGGFTTYGQAPLLPGDDTASLSEEDERTLLRIITGINATGEDSLLTLSLRRWDIQSERFRDDDKLLDCWIAFEALVTPDSNEGLRFRASLRVASFVGEPPAHPTDIYADMKTSYDWRSAIIHGDQDRMRNLEKKTPLTQVVTRTRGYLQKLLLKVLVMEDPNSFKPSEIEKRMLER